MLRRSIPNRDGPGTAKPPGPNGAKCSRGTGDARGSPSGPGANGEPSSRCSKLDLSLEEAAGDIAAHDLAAAVGDTNRTGLVPAIVEPGLIGQPHSP